MEIGQKLKEKRTGLGLSQEQLAEQLGVTRQTVANWEKGKTYPDITSVLKLSDLYHVSLDELLKEDATMRKHVEDSALLPRKYWNLLFETAILLLPFGLLLAHWGVPAVGLGVQILGLLILPPLWIAKHRLFGMSQEDLKYSLIGWALYAGSGIVKTAAGEASILMLIALIMQLLGWLMVYRHGVEIELGTRFWLFVFLWFGIPAYILGSTMVGFLHDQGGFTQTQPFGYEYRILRTEVGTAENPNAIIILRSFPPALILDEEYVGIFEAVTPTAHQKQTTKGIWHLVPENQPDTLYKLEISTEDLMTLSCLKDDQLQWRWELKKIPKVMFALTTGDDLFGSEMDWFSDGTYTGDPAAVSDTTPSGEASAYIQCNFEGVTQLTLIEEYHHNGQIHSREYTLVQDKDGNFPLPEDPVKRYEDGVQYILYRLQWEGGEYLFCLKFA